MTTLPQPPALLKSALFLLLLGPFPPGESRAQEEEFDQFKQQQERESQDFAEESEARYDAFAAADRAAFEQFKEAVERQWGDYVGSTRKDWVEYGDNLDRRSRVDFERGQASVEVLVESGEAEAREVLREAVADLIEDRGTTSDYSVELPDGTQEAPRPLGAAPVLEGQVAGEDGTPVAAGGADAFARQVTSPAR